MNEDSLAPEKRYYENQSLWAQDFEQDPDQRFRFDATMALIPAEVRSVLDVGCGNGAFIHRLRGKFERLCGVDRSEAALAHVQTEKQMASADRLPFADQSFDLVTSMEVIEHLPQGAYNAALAEIARVSSRWVIITVPYKEKRRLSLVRCPHCLCEFNRNYHLRSFDGATLENLFGSLTPDMHLVSAQPVGSLQHYPGLLAARAMAAPFRKLDIPSGAICPQCSYARPLGEGGSTGSLAGKGWKQIWPSYRRPRWWLALYKKEESTLTQTEMLTSDGKRSEELY